MSITSIQFNIELIQPSSAQDINTSNHLRSLSSSDAKKLKEASQDFEALFLSYLLKSMRETALTEENALFGNSRAEQIYTAMLDEQYAQEMAGTGGVGIWQLIFEQLCEGLETEKIATGTKIQVVIPTDEIQSAYASEDSALNAIAEIVPPDDNSQQLEIPLVISVEAQNQIGKSEVATEIKQNVPSNSEPREVDKQGGILGRHPYALALSIPTEDITSNFAAPPQKIVLEAVVPTTMSSESMVPVEQLPVEGASSDQSADNVEIVTAQQTHPELTESNPENSPVEISTTDGTEIRQLSLPSENAEQTQIVQDKSSYPENASLAKQVPQQSDGAERSFLEVDQISPVRTDDNTQNLPSSAPNDTSVEEGQSFARQIDRGAKPVRNFLLANKQEPVQPDVRVFPRGENTTLSDTPNSTDAGVMRSNSDFIPAEEIKVDEFVQHTPKSASSQPPQNPNSSVKTNAAVANPLKEVATSLNGVVEESSEERMQRTENLPERKTRQLTDASLKGNRSQNKSTVRGEAKGRSVLSQTLMQQFEPAQPPTQSHRIDSLRDTVLEQVIQRIRIIRTDTNSQVTIQLEPPELGQLNLRIVLEGNALTARFEAQNEFVANIIRGNLTQLNVMLSNHGIMVSGFEVAVSGGQAQLFQDNPAFNSSDMRNRRRRMRENEIDGVDSFTPAPDSQKYIVDYRL